MKPPLSRLAICEEIRTKRQQQADAAELLARGLLVRCNACRHGHVLCCHRVGEIVRYVENRTGRDSGVRVGAVGVITSFTIQAGKLRQDICVRFKVRGRNVALTMAPCELKGE